MTHACNPGIWEAKARRLLQMEISLGSSIRVYFQRKKKKGRRKPTGGDGFGKLQSELLPPAENKSQTSFRNKPSNREITW